MRTIANSTALIAVSRMDVDIPDSVLCQNLDHLPGAHGPAVHKSLPMRDRPVWGSHLGQIFTTRSDNKADLYHTNWTTLQIFTTRFDSRLARIKCLLFL